METAASTALDNPAWSALTGPQADIAERVGGAARFPADVAPFSALADPADPDCWDDLATLVGPDGGVVVLPERAAPPDGWTSPMGIPGVQLVAGDGLVTAPAPEAVVLGPADVPEMLALVAATRPGPFRDRTITLGRYVGIRRGGELVAMAGERLHPPGFTEISAVCTAESARGEGLATLLTRAVADGVLARGEIPILHASAANTNAIRLYLALGFELRARPSFVGVRPPA